ncbi:SAM-dependent chlorinase/fluorinase [Actinomadura graeca]|uniref:SAM-dependent chlorinase/fluorinase n=1 Tax=Actinomadura graeca TaxID=2750812 RepID=A0ABX8R164_9ACTN|nr:SAM-dependent chlorinase/fluorinase [Actinomadura graeca]QXJ24835.1 SAM-dependent chlorinase/fluorinase [Actinomadura graeca]
MPAARPFVSLTTDFGAAYTAICAGVVYSIAPAATVLVLSDEVTPYAVAEGAMLLRQALPYLPPGVHVGIVDPGVGTPRLPLAIETGRGDLLVGPDNGLFVPAAEELGGVVRAHILEDRSYRLPSVSATFHGRDVFSPAAAHLALGVDVAELGPPAVPLPLDVAPPETGGRALTAAVLYVDRFGSVILNAGPGDLAEALGDLEYGAALVARVHGTGGPAAEPVVFAETFGSVAVGDPLLWVDSSGHLGLAVNQGSAAARFGLGRDGTVTIGLAD